MLRFLQKNNLDIRIRNRISPDLVWRQYAKLCRAAGMRSSALILSFDCDSDDDIAVAWRVHEKLMDMGILSAYAVPGAQLENGADVYRRIANTGAEFLNHGGRAHTYYDEDKKSHLSCFFYEQQSQRDLEEDIGLGHERVGRVVGTAPRGWRTPHFGSFQEPAHFEFLYSTLRRLGYSYSTSAMPASALKYGPCLDVGGIREISLTGGYTSPLDNMDSWGYFFAEGARGGDAYVDSCQRLAEIAKKWPILINIYADPCHIADNQSFFEGVGHLIRAAQPTTFGDFLLKRA